MPIKRKIGISNIKFHTPDRLANSLAIHKAFEMNANDATNFVKANEIKHISTFTIEVSKENDEIIAILNDYHITCEIIDL